MVESQEPNKPKIAKKLILSLIGAISLVVVAGVIWLALSGEDDSAKPSIDPNLAAKEVEAVIAATGFECGPDQEYGYTPVSESGPPSIICSKILGIDANSDIGDYQSINLSIHRTDGGFVPYCENTIVSDELPVVSFYNGLVLAVVSSVSQAKPSGDLDYRLAIRDLDISDPELEAAVVNLSDVCPNRPVNP